MTTAQLDLDALKPIFDFELFKVRTQDREDVKNNAIVQILTSLSKSSVPAHKLFSYAQKVVRNTVVDYYRSRGRMIESNSTSVHFSDHIEEGEEISTFSAGTNDLGYLIAELRVDYARHSGEFTPMERRVVEFYLDHPDGAGMRSTEVSDALGIDKSTATRALKKLRKLIG